MNGSLQLVCLLCLAQLASCYYYQECTYSYATASWWCHYRRAVLFSSISLGAFFVLILVFYCIYCCISSSVYGVNEEPYIVHNQYGYGIANRACACGPSCRCDMPFDRPTSVVVISRTPSYATPSHPISSCATQTRQTVSCTTPSRVSTVSEERTTQSSTTSKSNV